MADSSLAQLLGQNLMQVRDENSLSRVKASALCEIPIITIQAYELGRNTPSTTRFLQLCNGLSVSPNRLVRGLVSWSTEEQYIQEYEVLFDSLSSTKKAKISRIMDIAISAMHNASSTSDPESFGARLNRLHVNAGYDIARFADKILIGRGTLREYECGQLLPSLATLLRICETLEVSLEYLLAPMLNKISYPETRFVNLGPVQIKACLEIIRNIINLNV